MLESHVLSKFWYLAQILPLPQVVAARATSMASSFLWLGHLERLAWQELHGKKEKGGLGVSCISTRGEALLAKQFCHQVATGGTPAGHLAFWLGCVLGYLEPAVTGGRHASMLLGLLVHVAEVLEEVFVFGTVTVTSPERATAAGIYMAFMDIPPPQRLRPGGQSGGTGSGGGVGAPGCRHTW